MSLEVKGYTLYFAYGSNMNQKQFQERCPASFVLCRAELGGYRFVLTTSGYASIVEKPGAVVHGLLCALAPADEATLDLKEGVAKGEYRREILEVETDLDYMMPALVYIDNAPMAEEGVVPKEGYEGYMGKILDGSWRHDLPPKYHRELEEWAPDEK